MVGMPPYDLIVGHERADVLLELVDVKPPGDTNYGVYVMEERDGDDDGYDDDDNYGGEEEEGLDEGIDEEEDDADDDSRILNVACCLVCIRPNKKARSKHPVWFWWEMSLVEDLSTMPNVDTWIEQSFGGDTYADGTNSSDRTGSVMYNDCDGITAIGSASSSSIVTSTMSPPKMRARWLVDCISPDFEDLDFEAESLSIENFMDEDDDDDDDDDEGGDYDDIMIFLDY